MNPFPANSLDDTENERPHSEFTTATVGAMGQPPNNSYNANGSGNPSTRQKISFAGQRMTDSRKQIKFREGVDVFVFRESFAVALWALTVPLLSMGIRRLIDEANQLESRQREGDLHVVTGLIAWLLLRLLPSKLLTTGAPGFLYSHSWILLRISETFNMYPNLGCRICEWRLGRLPKRALILAVFVHTFVPCIVWGSTSLFRQECSLSNEYSLYSLRYEENDNEQVLYHFFLQEVLSNMFFPVAIMVVPSLLKLNNYPEWMSFFVLYPLYSMGVDGAGRGSTLSPAAFMAQSIMFRQFQFKDNWRLIAQLVGNLLGGAVMQFVFPDQPRQ